MTVFKPRKYEVQVTDNTIVLNVEFKWSESSQELFTEAAKQKILAAADLDTLWWDVTYEYIRGNLGEERNVLECWFGSFDDQKTFIITKDGDGDIASLGNFVPYGTATVTATLKGFANKQD